MLTDRLTDSLVDALAPVAGEPYGLCFGGVVAFIDAMGSIRARVTATGAEFPILENPELIEKMLTSNDFDQIL